jgi:hypothetical protein
VSVAWVAWLLGRKPSLRIICASYSEELAHKFSRDCRALMESRFYKRVFPTRLNPKKSTETEFETAKRGSRFATSVGGTLTGRGGDVLIVDDPTKANDANSQVVLEAANDWFRNTARSRLNDQSKSLVVVTQQRLHADDLSGTLIDRGWPSLVIRSAKIGYRWIFDPQLHETIRDTGSPRRSQVARARDAGVGGRLAVRIWN